ncbi:FAD dependent oxidoreductase [Penicillium chermesinum]|uniref:FAD dependent oxidoreductase n=1 Tax=Penicillium chermesinum TaxID=63820 RepID=A0A9W9PLT2_9EURO|nr:FAD dependent oxidoreductase [Penicillium chermesinum]KAJ5248710.1 FAD dependent oxidoreductase [Penicillium chermesinum]
MEPSLPHNSSTLSHWHRTTRSFPHLHANRLNTVPAAATYVIIGSGISGALTGWELIKSGVKGDEIIILEAREAVSGASARNAGHIRPDSFRGFPGYATTHGSEQARKILENERTVLKNVHEFVKQHNVDCDFKYTTTYEVAISEDFVELLSTAFTAFKAAGGDVSHIQFHEGEKAKQKTGVPTAICAYESPAASNHPGKLVQWILNDFIQKGGKLWTHCPATKVGPAQAGASKVGGTIAAKNVVHCTNAYAAYLLPELKHFISPRRSQVNSFTPRLSLSGEYAPAHTMALRYSPDHFFSVNTLKNGTILFGGTGTRGENDVDKEFERATFDDSKYSETLARNSSREFDGISRELDSVPLRHGEGFDYAWTGIIGTTPDNAPLIGAIDGLPGQWICAGFNGHGMAHIFTCAPGLAKLVLGKSWKETALPECFQFSKERITQYSDLHVKARI